MCDSNSPNNLTPAERSRLNGSKSKGPITPEGKAVSSQNARTHGAYATSNVLLLTECAEAYDLIREAFKRRFNPSDPFEDALVCELCATEWLISRNHAIATTLINAQIAVQQLPPDLQKAAYPQPAVTALAVRHLLDSSRTLAHVQRQIQKLNAARARLLDTLYEARRKFPVSERLSDPDDSFAPIISPQEMLEQSAEDPDPGAASSATSPELSVTERTQDPPSADPSAAAPPRPLTERTQPPIPAGPASPALKLPVPERTQPSAPTADAPRPALLRYSD